ncbi:MAG: CRISPR-associated endoribonuclease Cas6 [Cyclobacteriaceae bacterium]
MVGAIHEWIGNNTLHDTISLYCFSQLRGSKVIKNDLDFKQGAKWFISGFDITLMKKIISGIMADPNVCFGMTVKDIVIQETPDLSSIEYFHVASPIFIKRTINNAVKHFLYTDKEANNLLVETLKNKMQKIGLVDDSLEIEFDINYPKAKTKLLTYNTIKNKANYCPVRIKGKPETKQFAWDVGIGNSTGIGFGALI